MPLSALAPVAGGQRSPPLDLPFRLVYARATGAPTGSAPAPEPGTASMLNCLFVGDSIALGLAQAVNSGGPVCAVVARVGAGSGALALQIARAPLAPVVVVSIGSNDPRNAALELNALRSRVLLAGARVAWVLPYDRAAAYRITRVAFRYGDPIVDLSWFGTRDRLHPIDYRAVARRLLAQPS